MRVFGSDFEAFLRFKIDENGGLVQVELKFLRVEHMEKHHFVSVEPQRFDGAHDFFGRFVEIGNHHHQAAAAQEFLKMEERLGEIGARARFGELQASQKPLQLPLARGRADVIADFVVENDQAGGVALILDREIKERGRNVA